MPFVNVQVIEGVFTQEEKGEMIQGITDALIAVEGENLRSATTVVISEVRSGDWSIGGIRLTTADVHTLQGRVTVSAAI